MNQELKGLDLLLGIMLTLCALIQTYLVNISNSTSSLIWSSNILLIAGFFLGVIRYKIFDNSVEDRTRIRYFIGFLLIANILLIGIILQIPISNMDMIGGGVMFPMLAIEESTWFLLFNLGQRVEAIVPTADS